MPTFVVLYQFTEQGRKNVKETVRRASEVQEENQRRGFNIQGLYWTMGQYDLVAIVDAPDEQSMLAGLFNISEAGNVQSQTLRAFNSAEMEQALKGS